MKIVSFGHIPSWAGGKQESGLANVIYQIAKHGSEVENVNVTLAATDVFRPIKHDDKLSIMGWTKRIICEYISLHPIRFTNSLWNVIFLKRKYPIPERLLGILIKRIFLDYILHKVKPDIVHLHSTSAIWYLDLIPKDTKVAVTFHGMCGLDYNLQDRNILYNIEKDIFHSEKVDELFFICTQLADEFKTEYGNNGKKNLVIFNSFDNNNFYFRKDEFEFNRLEKKNRDIGGKVTLCTVASLSDLKGQKRVLSGIAMLSDHKSFRYICIGDGKATYADKLDAYAVENNIDFNYLGKMQPKDIRKYLYEADYMIMPSSSEGFGLTYLEAIACGVPVILPRNIPIASEKELINEHNSILLDDCSSESISKVLSHITKYSFIPEKVSASIASITWDDVAKQYIDAFNKM